MRLKTIFNNGKDYLHALIFGVVASIVVTFAVMVLFILGKSLSGYRIEIVPPVTAETACIDGILQQGVPGDWQPVFIRKSKRTIPCEQEDAL